MKQTVDNLKEFRIMFPMYGTIEERDLLTKAAKLERRSRQSFILVAALAEAERVIKEKA